jgi:hypothetical protein
MIRVKSGLMQSEIAPPPTKDVFVVRTIFTLKLYTPFPFLLRRPAPTLLSHHASSKLFPWNGSDFAVCADHEL